MPLDVDQDAGRLVAKNAPMPAKLLRQDFLGALAVIAVAAFAYWLARNLPAGAAGGMGPGALPKGLALLLGALGVILLFNSFSGEGLGRWSIRGPLFVLGALVLFGLAVRPLGLVVAGPLAIAAAAFGSSEVRWRETLIYGLGMTLFCVALFKFALGLPIPLAPWLVGY
jgi:putative tricarboxylic transport membrane protein